jgi:hypothetical protein
MRDHLSVRDNWQDDTSKKARHNEDRTYSILFSELDRDTYKIELKPKLRIGEASFVPELLVENITTGKKMIIDDKYGDNGGNAHERCYRYFTGQVKESGFIPMVVFSGRTFAEEKPYYLITKNGKKVRVNPQKYREELSSLLQPTDYFIFKQDLSNQKELIDRITSILK